MLSASLLSTAISCATPPDIPVCTRLSAERGFCTYTISDKEFFVDGEHKFENQSWKEIEASSVMMPASSYAKVKAYILKMCKKSGQCKDLASWERKSATLEKKGKK